MRRISLLTLPVLFTALIAMDAHAQRGQGGRQAGTGFQHSTSFRGPSFRGPSFRGVPEGTGRMGLAPRSFGAMGVGTPGFGPAGVGTPGFGPAGVGTPGFGPAGVGTPGFAPAGAGLRGMRGQLPSSSSRRGATALPDFSRHFTAGHGDRGHGSDRHPYKGRNRGRRSGVGFVGYTTYLVPNMVGYPYGFGLPFDGDSENDGDQGAAYQPEASAENSVQPIDHAEAPAAESMAPANLYRPEYQPYLSQPVSAPVNPQPATTLIFKDGKPNEEVHNYVLTSTTLYGFDNGRRREIPLSELNLPATIAANRSAGVDFALPGS